MLLLLAITESENYIYSFFDFFLEFFLDCHFHYADHLHIIRIDLKLIIGNHF